MLKYISRRFITVLPIFLLMTIILFSLIHLIPGDPVDVLYGGQEGMTEERREVLTHSLGLDKPIYVQYIKWLGRAVVFDLGYSYRAAMPVIDLIKQRLPATLYLAIGALLFSIVISIPMGIIAAIHHNTWVDFSALIFSMFGISIPQFWSGIMFVLIFAVSLGWLPSMGFVSPFENFFQSLKHLLLPAITLGWSLTGSTTRLTRSTMLEELGKDYIRTARSKGISEQLLLWKHAFRNAMIPTLTMIGLQIAWMVGGSVVVEVIYTWPGIGTLVVDSILKRDYPVVQGVIMTIAVLVVLISLVVDIVYSILDPRIRLS